MRGWGRCYGEVPAAVELRLAHGSVPPVGAYWREGAGWSGLDVGGCWVTAGVRVVGGVPAVVRAGRGWRSRRRVGHRRAGGGRRRSRTGRGRTSLAGGGSGAAPWPGRWRRPPRRSTPTPGWPRARAAEPVAVRAATAWPGARW